MGIEEAKMTTTVAMIVSTTVAVIVVLILVVVPIAVWIFRAMTGKLGS